MGDGGQSRRGVERFLAALQGALVALNKQRSILRRDLRRGERLRANVEREVTQLRRQLKEHRRMALTLRTDVAHLRAERDDARADVSALKSEFGGMLEKERRERRRAVERARQFEDLAHQAQRVSLHVDRADRLQIEVDELRRDNNRLRRTLSPPVAEPPTDQQEGAVSTDA